MLRRYWRAHSLRKLLKGRVCNLYIFLLLRGLQLLFELGVRFLELYLGLSGLFRALPLCIVAFFRLFELLQHLLPTDFLLFEPLILLVSLDLLPVVHPLVLVDRSIVDPVLILPVHEPVVHQADEFIFRVFLLLRGKFQWVATCIGFDGFVQLA